MIGLKLPNPVFHQCSRFDIFRFAMELWSMVMIAASCALLRTRNRLTRSSQHSYEWDTITAIAQMGNRTHRAIKKDSFIWSVMDVRASRSKWSPLKTKKATDSKQGNLEMWYQETHGIPQANSVRVFNETHTDMRPLPCWLWFSKEEKAAGEQGLRAPEHRLASSQTPVRSGS